MEVKMVVLNGKQKNQEIALPRTMFVIGRGQKCHLRPNSPLVSRRHCAITMYSSKVTVRDFGSANGTFVNGQRVQGEVKIGDGDVLQVANLLLGFRIPSEQGSTDEEIDPQTLEWLMMLSKKEKKNLDDSTFEMNIVPGSAPQTDPSQQPAPTSDDDLTGGLFLEAFLKARKKFPKTGNGGPSPPAKP
jgi:predicted component of type VI protein secretion system